MTMEKDSVQITSDLYVFSIFSTSAMSENSTGIFFVLSATLSKFED